MKLSPKMWAWGSGILGILLVICGFLSQQKTPAKSGKCEQSSYTWVSIVVGFMLVLAGFMTLMKMNKVAGGGRMNSEASISPEPSPDGMGEMGGMGGMGGM